jgi:uncharacterized membrane protein YccC
VTGLPPWLSDRRFDFVFSFGVLHHTGDTRRALGNIARLVGPAGALFLYLYGSRSAAPAARTLVNTIRLALSPLPFGAKSALLARLLLRRDPHQAFDLLSPTINETHSEETVTRWLVEEGFAEVTRTLPHGDLFLRATRSPASLPTRPAAGPPFWFERYARRRRSGSNGPFGRPAAIA